MIVECLSRRKSLLVGLITVVSLMLLMLYLKFWRGSAAYYIIYPESSVGVFEEHLFKKKFENWPEFGLRASTGKYFLVVLVLSRPTASERRDSIRDSWINGNRKLLQSQEVLVRFSIGLKGASEEVINKLKKEQSTHSDLLLLENFEESYSKLTQKVLMSFVAIHKHFNLSYLLKCDDDSFVLLDIIVKELNQRNSQRNYYWGRMIEGAKVFHSGKFAESEWNLGEKYIPYASGAGYILSENLIEILVQNSDNLMLYHNEDVAVSAWITPYNVERQHDSRVCENIRYWFYKCRTKAVIIHPIKSSQDMLSLQTIYSEIN